MKHDPLQSLLCWYASQIKTAVPYYEPIRAIPLPEKGMPMSGTQKTDRAESMIIGALDSSDQIEDTLLAIRSFLYTLADDDRRFVEMLCAYPSSSYQFDFATISLVILQRETGICARPYPSDFRMKKARRRARITERWESVRQQLTPLLVLYRGKF